MSFGMTLYPNASSDYVRAVLRREIQGHKSTVMRSDRSVRVPLCAVPFLH